MENNPIDPDTVLIIGAGPNGLAAAAFLSACGARVMVHGEPMASWKDLMPDRMILRSSKISSNIASPEDSFSIYKYEKQTGIQVDHQPTIRQFIDYGLWFQKQAVPDVSQEKVIHLDRIEGGFSAALENGRPLRVRSVVLAAGITPFPYIPDTYSTLPSRLVSHTSGYRSFDAFKGQKVVVIGRGQSALESAAILHESGAQVEILTRGKMIHFINREERRDLLGRIAAIPEINHFLYPPTDLAGPPHNWAIADPVIYRQLSKEKQALLFRLVGPMGSTDLETRLAEVPITTRVEVLHALALGDGVSLSLSDGSRRMVDHVFLATGFRPNINYCGFLSKDLTAAIAQEEGYPLLTLGYESTTVKGLYVLGALACKSLGPINRFVCGTYLVGQYLTEAVTGSRLGYPHGAAQRYVTGRRLAYRLYQVSGISDMLALRRQKVPTT